MDRMSDFIMNTMQREPRWHAIDMVMSCVNVKALWQNHHWNHPFWSEYFVHKRGVVSKMMKVGQLIRKISGSMNRCVTDAYR